MPRDADTGTESRTRIPGEEGIWVIVCGDLVIFGLLFATFAYYRNLDPGHYAPSQRTLSQVCGVTNTVILLTSSWFVARAVQAARRLPPGRVRPLFAAAIACGAGFVGVKIFEYAMKISAGLTISTNDFFMFYFMLTGIHLLHVLIGLGVLSYAYVRAGRAQLAAGDLGALESCGIFWHLVDLLWVVLFAIFYLMR